MRGLAQMAAADNREIESAQLISVMLDVFEDEVDWDYGSLQEYYPILKNFTEEQVREFIKVGRLF